MTKLSSIFLCLVALFALGAHASAEEVAVITTSDFAAGNVSLLREGAASPALDVLPIHNDNAVFVYGDYVYVLERFGADNLLKVAADDIAPSGVVYQYSVGNGANPHSMVFLNEHRAYITRNDDTMLWVVDPSATSEETFKIGEIDLSAYADDDGLPEMSPMAIAGGKLYVGCQRIDRNAGWTPQDGRVVVIDTGNDTVLGEVVLEKGNPQSLAASGGKLYVSSAASLFDPSDGAIEWIDLATDTYGGVRITEAELEGNVGELLFRSSSKAYVIVGNWPDYVVRPADLDAGEVLPPLEGSLSANAMALSGTGTLFVLDRSQDAPGIYMYDASDNLIAGPIPTGLPPSTIALVGGDVPTPVAETTSEDLPTAYALEPCYPNPFNPSTSIPYVVAEEGGTVDLSVYDALGRTVATLVQGVRPAGRYVTSWTGTDDAGHPVASGMYVVRMRAGGYEQAVKVMFVQ